MRPGHGLPGGAADGQQVGGEGRVEGGDRRQVAVADRALHRLVEGRGALVQVTGSGRGASGSAVADREQRDSRGAGRDLPTEGKAAGGGLVSAMPWNVRGPVYPAPSRSSAPTPSASGSGRGGGQRGQARKAGAKDARLSSPAGSHGPVVSAGPTTATRSGPALSIRATASAHAVRSSGKTSAWPVNSLARSGGDGQIASGDDHTKF